VIGTKNQNIMKIKIATSQFPISADIEKNKLHIIRQMEEATNSDADVIHFPESSLSGHAGIDFDSFENFDWALLKSATLEIIAAAKAFSIWVILGSAHRLTTPNKPHVSLYIINDSGEIVDRYDKMFCAGSIGEDDEELKHYASGNDCCNFEIKGIKCGVQICHEYRYPELYRVHKKKGAQIMFHSFHAGNMTPTRQEAMENQVGKEFHHLNFGNTLPEITMPATMTSYAANNYVWISCSNTSGLESCWASFMVRPDGVTVGKLQKNETRLLITEIDTSIQYYDSTLAWRQRAMDGQYHSGSLVEDDRSRDKVRL